MRIVRTVAEYRALGLEDVGFVPTMGALHEGHCSLIRSSLGHKDRVVSIFVNPTQFAPHEDLSRYPRPFERDVERAANAGANVLFAPSVEEMYPEFPTMIHVPVVSENFDGRSRPGHFDGVATVVAKLFNIVQPRIAYFGQKDLQQCSVITKLVSDLNMPVEIKVMPTIREDDGLAMSSRNSYLSPKEREIAPRIYQALSFAKQEMMNGVQPDEAVSTAIASLNSFGFVVDYFAMIDRKRFEPADSLGADCALITAAKLGTTRLIDNVLLD